MFTFVSICSSIFQTLIPSCKICYLQGIGRVIPSRNYIDLPSYKIIVGVLVAISLFGKRSYIAFCAQATCNEVTYSMPRRSSWLAMSEEWNGTHDPRALCIGHLKQLDQAYAETVLRQVFQFHGCEGGAHFIYIGKRTANSKIVAHKTL